MSAPKLKLHKILIDAATPLDFMVYAETEAKARAFFIDKFLRISRATDLEIAAHCTAQKPILNLPKAEDAT